MFGIFSQQPNTHLQSIDDLNKSAGGGGGGNGNIGAMTSITSAPSSPQQLFDLSVLSGLKPSDKYLGKNRVSDIQEAYQTYITGNPIGRGGQYAIDSARKYGVSIIEAARGYLQGVGLPILPQVTTQTTQDTTTTQNTTTTTQETKNPFEVLADAFSKAFGNAVYNPPLQQQSYGYTPAELSQPLAQSSGGSGIGLYVILAIIAIVGYFLYKKFAS